MPPLVYVTNDIIRFRFKGTYYGEAFQVVQHFRWKNPDPNTGAQLAVGVPPLVLPTFQTMMVTEAKWLSVGICRVRPAPKQMEENFPIAVITGNSPGHGMPHQLATLYRTFCAEDGDEARGRIYIPGVPMNHFENGNYTNPGIAAGRAIALSLGAKFRIGGDNHALEWGVFRKDATTPADGIWIGMQQCFFSLYPGTMRSRRPTLT